MSRQTPTGHQGLAGGVAELKGSSSPACPSSKHTHTGLHATLFPSSPLCESRVAIAGRGRTCGWVFVRIVAHQFCAANPMWVSLGLCCAVLCCERAPRSFSTLVPSFANLVPLHERKQKARKKVRHTQRTCSRSVPRLPGSSQRWQGPCSCSTRPTGPIQICHKHTQSSVRVNKLCSPCPACLLKKEVKRTKEQQ